MEDQTSWKGHSFTLMVFTGIVVLSSIFFILGMLVGRAQGQKLASDPVAVDVPKTDAAAEATEEKPALTFYDSVKKEQPAALEPAPPPKADPPAEIAATKASTKPGAPAPVTSKPENVIHYQIGAMRKAADAEKLLDGVKKKGFRAFILAPGANDPNPFFRVQVGPFADPVEAQNVKKKLEAAGFQAIVKK
jgi:cell division septation protein DedD